METKKIFISFLLILSHSAFCQNWEGEIQYEKSFNWTKVLLPLTYIPEQEKESYIYRYGKASEEWGKENMVLYFNKDQARYTYSPKKRDEETYSWSRNSTDYLTKLTANKIYWHVDFLAKPKIIEDTIRVFNWKVENEIKEVAGYLCMKASTVDSVMNHKIVAWFAMDLPVPAGPDRFMGLPGMILELDMNNGGQIFTAQTVVLRPLKLEELQQVIKKKAKKTSLLDYHIEVKKHILEKEKLEEYPFWGLQY